MTLPRALAVAVVVAAVATATVLDVVPPQSRPTVDGQFVLAADLHVHAAAGDGGVPPWELSREARRRRLDIIVVANHNQLLAARLAAWRGALRGQPIVLIGQEVTTPGFHMIAAGIEATVDWRLSASEAIAEIHRQGGVAIAAHPVPGSWMDTDENALRALDGAEVAHPLIKSMPHGRSELRAFFDRAAAVNPSLAPIGSSDFHFGGRLGECRTFIFADAPTEAGVLEAIRAGRTVAFDGDGYLVGDSERVERVRTLLSDAPPPVQAPRPARIAAVAAMAGLLMLLLFK
jgi:predicted metal-dependent phosphoesterase TrpH